MSRAIEVIPTGDLPNIDRFHITNHRTAKENLLKIPVGGMEWREVALSVICGEPLSKNLKKMKKKTPAGSLGSLNITVICLVADLRYMRTNGGTRDGFDTHTQRLRT